jgi:hypothetical protein
MDEHRTELERLQQVIDRQRAILDLALETLEGVGFDLDDFAAATLD